MDLEARPFKSPRPFCASISVPDEIKLVVNPHGGQQDYRALFHEAGHAQQNADYQLLERAIVALLAEQKQVGEQNDPDQKD